MIQKTLEEYIRLKLIFLKDEIRNKKEEINFNVFIKSNSDLSKQMFFEIYENVLIELINEYNKKSINIIFEKKFFFFSLFLSKKVVIDLLFSERDLFMFQLQNWIEEQIQLTNAYPFKKLEEPIH